MANLHPLGHDHPRRKLREEPTSSRIVFHALHMDHVSEQTRDQVKHRTFFVSCTSP